jgi:hypothetical protein
MNKRAKKRIKETIEKENLERAKEREGKNHPSSNDLQKRRGFLPKPAKKRERDGLFAGAASPVPLDEARQSRHRKTPPLTSARIHFQLPDRSALKQTFQVRPPEEI